MADDLDLVDPGRGEHECPLHPHVVGDAANSERPVELLRSVLPDDDALEHLDALLATLDHLDVNADGIANLDGRALGSSSYEQLV